MKFQMKIRQNPSKIEKYQHNNNAVTNIIKHDKRATNMQ